MMPQFTAEGVKKGKQLLQLLNELASQKQATPAQISLAWLLCKKPYIIPIPGSRKQARLKENLMASEISLSKAEVEQIDQALDEMDFLVFGGH